MYNIKLIPYLGSIQIYVYIITPQFTVKSYDFGPSNIQLFLMFPMKSNYLSKIM